MPSGPFDRFFEGSYLETLVRYLQLAPESVMVLLEHVRTQGIRVSAYSDLDYLGAWVWYGDHTAVALFLRVVLELVLHLSFAILTIHDSFFICPQRFRGPPGSSAKGPQLHLHSPWAT